MLRNSEAPHPSLSELVPTFVFDPTNPNWATTAANPLERTLAKVERLALRRDLRQKVSFEWDAPERAPGALMVLHHTSKRQSWQTALAGPALKNQGQPEVILIDATGGATRTNPTAVRKIPEFLVFAKENGLTDAGAVIVTDDPKTFFILRAKLGDAKLLFSTKAWAAE